MSRQRDVVTVAPVDVADRSTPVNRTYDPLLATVRHPSDHRRVLLLAAAIGDGSVVGTAELTLRDSENAHTLELEIHVAPHHRRAGVGRRLWEAADPGHRTERTALRPRTGPSTVVGVRR